MWRGQARGLPSHTVPPPARDPFDRKACGWPSKRHVARGEVISREPCQWLRRARSRAEKQATLWDRGPGAPGRDGRKGRPRGRADPIMYRALIRCERRSLDAARSVRSWQPHRSQNLPHLDRRRPRSASAAPNGHHSSSSTWRRASLRMPPFERRASAEIPPRPATPSQPTPLPASPPPPPARFRERSQRQYRRQHAPFRGRTSVASIGLSRSHSSFGSAHKLVLHPAIGERPAGTRRHGGSVIVVTGDSDAVVGSKRAGRRQGTASRALKVASRKFRVARTSRRTLESRAASGRVARSRLRRSARSRLGLHGPQRARRTRSRAP